METNVQVFQEEAPDMELQKQSESYPLKARELAAAVKDDASYKALGDLLLSIRGFRKQIQAEFGPVVEKARDVVRKAKASFDAACELQSKIEAPLIEAEKISNPVMIAYSLGLERKKNEEMERQRAEQKKKDDDSRLAAAVQAEQNGDHRVAEAILEQPPAPIVFTPTSEAAKIDGISYRENWKCEVYDLKALVKAVAAGTVPMKAICPDQPELNRLAKALKEEVKYPGVRVWCEKVLVNKGAA